MGSIYLGLKIVGGMSHRFTSVVLLGYAFSLNQNSVCIRQLG